PTDFVRLEVAQALARDIRVIPLLIDRTEMPSSTLLPDDLKSLAFRNALRVDSGADFHHHIDRLCALGGIVGGVSGVISGLGLVVLLQRAGKGLGLSKQGSPAGKA